MILLIISGTDYSKKIVDEPKEGSADLVDSADSFTSLANTRHRCVRAVKRRLTITLSGLTDGEKDALMSQIEGKNFPVAYKGEAFIAFCESRESTCYYGGSDGNLYDVSMTIEEV